MNVFHSPLDIVDRRFKDEEGVGDRWGRVYRC